MTLRFDATHEYFFGNARLTYWEDSATLTIWNDHEDRVMIHGVDMDKLKDFVTRTIPAKVLKQRTTKRGAK